MGSNVRRFLSMVMSGLLLGGPLAGMAQAVDGVKLIDQNKALAGNVTPGDAPGFPVTISQPGSYILASNLTVPDEDTSAIHVTTHNVTLDLNGFTIQGPTVCGGTPLACAPEGTGVGIRSFAIHTVVIDGTVRGMGSNGILVGTHSRVERVHAESNGFDGIRVAYGSTVSGNTAMGNGFNGISTAPVSADELVGGTTVIGNTATGNGFNGIDAVCLIVADCFGSTVSGNTASANGGHGIVAEGGSTVTGNTASFNNGVGLFLDPHAGYTQNVMISNSFADVVGGVSLGQNLCAGLVC